MIRLVAFIALLFLSGCSQNQSDSAESHAFFVVGHAYGNPITFGTGMHPPLLANLDRISDSAPIDFGVLYIILDTDNWLISREQLGMMTEAFDQVDTNRRLFDTASPKRM